MAVIDMEYGREVLGELERTQDPGREIMEMEMVLQNSSLSHEYAMMKLGDSQDFFEKQSLDQQLEESKNVYFQARQYLNENHPERLKVLERELVEQKVRMFRSYQA